MDYLGKMAAEIPDFQTRIEKHLKRWAGGSPRLIHLEENIAKDWGLGLEFYRETKYDLKPSIWVQIHWQGRILYGPRLKKILASLPHKDWTWENIDREWFREEMKREQKHQLVNAPQEVQIPAKQGEPEVWVIDPRMEEAKEQRRLAHSRKTCREVIEGQVAFYEEEWGK